ncbi:DUF1573 domain-containing protein [Aquimarina sp. 2201CG5-10]|uniref:DUF1573 domain-containing protein n=1 Tax=Aquimarina callyspongiae TaxID=3098150 RepID=UPI002AB46ED7|nr:DUF1573 domain-containing protein [Aquimarina sp. 2201CG5-10]MDY8134238.1 DUF1573 domain-containing protein [Aquimarina sp. 2201CG5-10]
MRKVMMILFIGFLGTTLQAQDKAKIEFKNDVIDYGEIAKGSNGVRQFEFTNTGNAPLVISKVSSSCGCTIPKKPEEPIAPGATGIIEVKYDTKRVGPFRKTISVYTNAGEMPKPIKIKGTVLDNTKSVLEKKN